VAPAPVHPSSALHDGEPAAAALPACVHYAGSERFLRKALAIQQALGPVFDITGDCEDGAAVGDEIAHARMVAALVASPENHHGRMGARIHDPAHPAWRSELEILVGEAGERLAFVTVPKVDGRGDVQRVQDALEALRARRALARPIPLSVMVETHGALRDVFAIAALPGVVSVDFGPMDFVSAHRGAIPAAAMQAPGIFEHPLTRRALCEIAAAAHAAGVVPAQGPSLALDDPATVEAETRRSRDEFGMLRKWSIHPSQIEAVLAGMRPSAAEVATAEAILVAAQDANWAPIRHAGELHDRADYRYYWHLLQRAHATGLALSPESGRRFFGSVPS
jgi:citrate lyase subunit beta/citryl-CoA lyase